MTITRVGTNQQYADNWEQAFGKGKKATKKTAVAPATKKAATATAKKAVKKKTAKKKATKKSK